MTSIPVLVCGAKASQRQRLLWSAQKWLSFGCRSRDANLALKTPIRFIHQTRCALNRRPDSSRPEFWYEDYPIALIGQRQSPINIRTENCVLNNKSLTLEPLVVQYPPLFSGLTLKNPRDQKFYGWRVDVPYDQAEQTELSGGPLDHRYRLAQFHCHWGKHCSCGSEHTINGDYHSAELHFVHWNSDLFTLARDAVYTPNGLAVIAVFLQVDDNADNDELEKLTTAMSRIRFKGNKFPLHEPINVNGLLPTDRSYWTYLGSLTTPPLWESVTWIVFKQPVRCSPQQLKAFQQISYFTEEEVQNEDNHGCEINVLENYRPPQPLNNRTVIYVNKS